MEDAKILSLRWIQARRFLSLKKWSVGFNSIKKVTERKTMWAKLPRLPLELWSKKATMQIANKIDKYYYVDKGCTRVLDTRTSQVFLEVDLTSGLLVTLTYIGVLFPSNNKLIIGVPLSVSNIS